MARKARLHVAGGVYHVILRGNAGQVIFSDDEDRCRFCLLLQEGAERFDYRVHGFCLMDNHVHLALQVAETPLAKPLQNLSFRFTRWTNWRQGRVGHLFQGRYKAVLVDQDSYLLELVRYVHLSPVRAGMVSDPAEHPWSGHRAYLGKEVLEWLTTDWVLSQFGPNLRTARRRYEKFIRAGIGGSHDDRFHAGDIDARILGPDRFIAQVLGSEPVQHPKPPPLNTIERAVCRAYRLTSEQLAASGASRQPAQARSLVALLAMRTGAASLTDVAQGFNRDVATLSTGVRRLTLKIRASADEKRPWQRPIRRFKVKV
jgi:REP element-mobilizing transposase RayT